MSKQIISTPDAPAAIGTYSQAVRVGNTVYLSGQIPLDPATMQLVSGDIDAEIRRVFDNLAAVAKAAGGTLDDAVEGHRVPHRPCALRPRERDHGHVFPAALSGTRCHWRCRAATRRPRGDGVRAESLKPALVASSGCCNTAVAAAADPLFLLPARYEDRTRITPIGALLHGMRAVVEGEVQLVDVVFRRRRAMLVRISDGSGFLNLRFFYFSRAQQEGLARGTRMRCVGEARRGPQGLEMVHPEYRRVGNHAEPLDDRLTPIYPLTEGQTQGRVRVMVNKALARLAANPGAGSAAAPASSTSCICPRCAKRWSSCITRRWALRWPRWPKAGIPRSGDWPSRNCWRTSSRCSS